MKSKNNEDHNRMALGLDVGTSRIVLAGRNGEDYTFRSERNSFVAVPFAKMSQRTLARERIPHLVRGGELFIYGEQCERFADLFHLEARRPMNRGMLNPAEPDGLLLIRRMIESLSGDAKPPAKICFSVPAPPLGAEASVTYHEAALRELLVEMGYEPFSINEGLAVIYSELDDSNYTGIGISFGGGLCNVCLAYLSAPLFSFSVPKAGDFIDASVASVCGELATRVRIVKEGSFHFNGKPAEKVQQALSVYYTEMMDGVATGLKSAFANTLNVPKIGRPVPVVLSGGSALPNGFRERFEEILSASSLPVPLSDVRLAADPLNATAKGALVAALAEI